MPDQTPLIRWASYKEAPDRWRTPEPQWKFESAKDPEWQNPTTVRRVIAEDEIDQVADAIVTAKTIVCQGPDGQDHTIVGGVGEVRGLWDRHHTVCERVIIEHLRPLIDAVQAHSEVRLAHFESEMDGKFLRVTRRWVADVDGNEVDEPATRLTLWHCVIETCELEGLDIGVTLNAPASFAGFARFGSASFAGDARFISAGFAGDAWFESASFAGDARFISAGFAGDAGFYSASFAGAARFDSASFAGEAWFISASFAGSARFDWASFAGDAGFVSAGFAGDARFDSASFAGGALYSKAKVHADLILTKAVIERRLALNEAEFGPDARLALNDLIQRAGASVELSMEQLTRREPRSKRIEQWNRKARASIARWAGEPESSWTWTQDYPNPGFLMPVRWSIHRLSLLAEGLSSKLGHAFAGKDRVPLGLGMGPRGTLIKGEDSDDREALALAAKDYNQLRDYFRSQPSTDKQEEICTIKHHDLSRRACEMETKWSYVPRAFQWLVMRNMLGYLVDPTRLLVSGFVMMLIFAGIYQFAIGIDDISHGSFKVEGTTLPNGEIEYRYPDAFKYWKNDKFNPIYLSLMTFVTLGYGDFQPAAGWLKLVTGLEGLLGVTLLALFTVAWGRKMVR